MANTSTRTLRLLSLLQARRYWPGAELAERLRVSPRTLRRDIDRLRELGYPVQAQRGVEGGRAGRGRGHRRVLHACSAGCTTGAAGSATPPP